jgi:hypothetical protein
VGAWGTGPFENDDAADWRYPLVDGAGPEVVAEALDAVAAEETADAATASNAVAAAAVVAAGLGDEAVDVPQDVRARLAAIDASAWPPLAARAVSALDRVLAASELRVLWEEAGDDSWASETRELRDAIASRAR